MLEKYISTAQAIQALLHPFAEVVIHDLKTGKIAAIFGNFSKRKVGEDSLIEGGTTYPDFFEPYYKRNWDGRPLKSTTATIRDENEEAVGLLCINLDISYITNVQELIQTFLAQGKQPHALFYDDWKEKISAFVHEYMRQERLSLQTLTRPEKKALIAHLYRQGGFRAKRSADYVGEVLGLSRATVYQYLKEAKRDETPPL